MPRLVKVYRIVNSEADDVFIGSTSQPLYKRLYLLRADALSGKASALCDLMRQLGKDKFRIELLEEFPYTSADQTKAVEQKYAPKTQNSNVSSGSVSSTSVSSTSVSSTSDFDIESSFCKLYAKLADIETQIKSIGCRLSIDTPLTHLVADPTRPALAGKRPE